MLRKDDKFVAGLGPKMNEQMPTAWNTYVTVNDADETAAKVQANDGSVVLPTMDVMDAGRMAVFTDPQGAAFSVWQPNLHHGAQLVNEPGTLAWNELDTRDTEGAKAFYGNVFGWGDDTQQTPGGPYTTWMIDGQMVGGMMEIGEQFPPDVPNNWLTYFAVDDTDASVTKAGELGGTAIVEPMDTQAGRFAVLADPQGAVFGVIALSTDAG